MPKLKTHKGVKKRVKVTAKGKVKRSKAGKGHLLSGKTGRRKQRLKKKIGVSDAFNKKIKRALNVI